MLYFAKFRKIISYLKANSAAVNWKRFTVINVSNFNTLYNKSIMFKKSVFLVSCSVYIVSYSASFHFSYCQGQAEWRWWPMGTLLLQSVTQSFLLGNVYRCTCHNYNAYSLYDWSNWLLKKEYHIIEDISNVFLLFCPDYYILWLYITVTLAVLYFNIFQ